MSDGNYTFDSDSLSYEKSSPQKGRKFLISLITQILAAISIGLIVFLTISYTIKTPRQKKIERENEIMKKEYETLGEKLEKVDSVLKDIKQRDQDIYRAIFETELTASEDKHTRRDKFAEAADTDSLKNLIRAMTNNSAEMLKQEEATFSELKFKLLNTKENLKEIPSILPVNDPSIDIIYYGFGKKLDPIYKTPNQHKGIDIAATTGTEIYATANGVVEAVGDKQEYGKYITINHKNGYKTTYAHMSESIAKIGQKIKRGEVIGFVGNTGKSLTPHLHYEVWYKGKAINPINYFFQTLKPEQWNKVAYIANSRGLSLD